MTIAPFKDFMAAVDRQIKARPGCCQHCLYTLDKPEEHDASGAGCDRIPQFINGRLVTWRVNEARPGAHDRQFRDVERDAFETECAANPPTSSLGNIIRLEQIIRFNARHKKKETP